MCSPIGHNIIKHFLCPIRNWHLLEFLEMVRWESVTRGSFALTWKLSSRLFSRPDLLPLGLRECPLLTYQVAQSRGLIKPPLGRYRMRVGEGGSRGSETPAFHTLHFGLPLCFPWLPPFSQLLPRLPYPSRPLFSRPFCPLSSPA